MEPWLVTLVAEIHRSDIPHSFFKILHSCNEGPLTFGFANLQKYFFNIQWHSNTDLDFQNNSNIIKTNEIPSTMYVKLDGAYRVDFDIPNILIPNHWYTIALITSLRI